MGESNSMTVYWTSTLYLARLRRFHLLYNFHVQCSPVHTLRYKYRCDLARWGDKGLTLWVDRPDKKEDVVGMKDA